MKTRPVDRFRAKDYLTRAEELKKSMERSYENEEWNACVINAIHCAISAADAFCVSKKGLRSAGDSHFDTISLFLSTGPDDAEIRRSANHLSALVGIKSAAEYGDRLLDLHDAEMAVKHADRLFEFVKSKIS